MTCRDYIEHHTALLDGDLPDDRVSALSGHARACPACTDYDRSVRRSLELLREVDTIDVSDDFALRLQHRLLHVREEEAGTLRRSSPTMAAAVAVAAFLALAAWSPWLMTRLAESPGGGVASSSVQQATSPATLPASGDHDATSDPWHGQVPPALFTSGIPDAGAAALYAIPGPSTPVIVAPPAMGGFAARAVSTRYVEFE